MEAEILLPAETSPKRVPGKYYPLELTFSYVALKRGQVIQRGLGKTVEISSASVRIMPLDVLNPSATGIVLSIAWPVKLDDGASLKWVIEAKPSWGDAGPSEFVIRKQEFRIASKRTLGLGARAGLGALAGADLAA
jgi:hypothetical protein